MGSVIPFPAVFLHKDLQFQTVRLLETEGIPVSVVSCGGTGTYDFVVEIDGIIEVQAGSYAMMDSTNRNLKPEFEYALSLLTTAISRPNLETAILDCGRKSLSQEFGMSGVVDLKGVEMINLLEEHGKSSLHRD